VRDVGFDERVSRQPFARPPQHIRGCIDPDDLRLRPARDQEFGGVAGTTTDIDDLARRDERDLRQQIARRPGPLVLELQILLGAPIVHRVPVLLSTSINNGEPIINSYARFRERTGLHHRVKPEDMLGLKRYRRRRLFVP